MRVVFLERALLDAEWFREYYRTIFPAGKANAGLHLKKARQLPESHPQIGIQSDVADLRELQILKTPFVLVYRVRTEEIQIVRFWDQRAERPESWI